MNEITTEMLEEADQNISDCLARQKIREIKYNPFGDEW